MQADALAIDWGDRQFDVVVGNPPFLNQLAAATTRGGRSRFGGGPYADAAAEFLALAVALARPDGGRVGLVLPQSMLSARATPARSAPTVAAQAALRGCGGRRRRCSTPRCACGPASGNAWRVAARCAGRSGRRSSPSIRRRHRQRRRGRRCSVTPTRSSSRRTTVRCWATSPSFTADFRDQYYGLVGAVGDDVDGPPLITSGLIEPDECLWGRRPVRFAKQRFAAPRVDLASLSPQLQRWAAARLVPKILIANQTAGSRR